MPETGTLQPTATVRMIKDDRVSFDGMNSWYQVPADLMPVFREAKQTHREVRFTHDRNCVVHAAELAAAAAGKGLLKVRLRGQGKNHISRTGRSRRGKSP
jgi:hypothetical protein